jgi:hypothetical protein
MLVQQQSYIELSFRERACAAADALTAKILLLKERTAVES